MVKSKEIRKAARMKLKNHWGSSVLAIVVFTIISLLVKGIFIYFLDFTGSTIADIILIPLMFGLWSYFFYDINDDSNVSDIFKYYVGYRLWKSVIVYIIFLIGLAISLIPVWAVYLFAYLFMNFSKNKQVIESSNLIAPNGSFLPLIISIIILLILLIPAIIYVYTYNQIVPIFIENPKENIRWIFNRSRILMKKNKWRLFRFQMSYIWWFIGAIFTLYIGFLWLTPYFITGQFEFYRTINKEFNDIQNDKDHFDSII